LRDYEVGAFVDLCFQMFNLFIFAEFAFGVAVRIGWKWMGLEAETVSVGT
jgi:hypothetical protein